MHKNTPVLVSFKGVNYWEEVSSVVETVVLQGRENKYLKNMKNGKIIRWAQDTEEDKQPNREGGSAVKYLIESWDTISQTDIWSCYANLSVSVNLTCIEAYV